MYLAIVMLSITSCQKNEFAEATVLDCRNLFVSEITLVDAEISLSVENTCSNCREVTSVYLGFEIFDLSNGRIDTIAISNDIYSMPSNGASLDYAEIKTNYTELPSLENIRVDFDKYCQDMTKK